MYEADHSHPTDDPVYYLIGEMTLWKSLLTRRQLFTKFRRDGVAMMLLENSGKFLKLQ